MRTIIFAGAVLAAGIVNAADYGTPEACALFSKGIELATPLQDDGRPYFFDGARLQGADWICDVATGQCESEGDRYDVSFSISVTPALASVTGPNGERTALQRCD